MYKLHQNFFEIMLWVKPGARRQALLYWSERGLELMVHAKAQDGEANKAVIALLAEFLACPKSAIEIHAGHQSRQKRCRIYDLSAFYNLKKIDKKS